ncbi:hypothetical protein F511_00038 [Dorcoceras hygrometricum]|nr:hypothetical protein F511_00038 [Dorcoceras hygrometricum]
MELCTARGISNLLFSKPQHITPNHIPCLILRRGPFLAHLKQTRSACGPRYTIVSCLSSTTEATTYGAEATTYEPASSPDDTTTVTTSPEDTLSEVARPSSPDDTTTVTTSPEDTLPEVAAPTSEATTYGAEATTYEPASSPEDTPTVTTSPEDTLSEAAAPASEEPVPEIAATEATSDIKDDQELDSGIAASQVVEPPPVEKKEDYLYQPDVVSVPQEDEPLQLLKFLDDLNIKFDFEDKYSIVALGVGGLIVLRLAVAVIGGIDSIPLLANVLELVGLGYTIWFTTRYLIFEDRREAFIARVKQLKEEVIG